MAILKGYSVHVHIHPTSIKHSRLKEEIVIVKFYLHLQTYEEGVYE